MTPLGPDFRRHLPFRTASVATPAADRSATHPPASSWAMAWPSQVRLDSPPVPCGRFPGVDRPPSWCAAAGSPPVGGSVPNRRWAGQVLRNHRVPAPGGGIRAVYVQGCSATTGSQAAGQQLRRSSWRTATISLRSFISPSGRSKGFPWGYWSVCLYITKALK